MALSVAESKSSACEFSGLDALQLTLSNRSDCQRVSYDGLEESGSINRSEKAFWKLYNNSNSLHVIYPHFLNKYNKTYVLDS